MITELGHFALILALLVALAQGVFSIAGAQLNKAAWMRLARPAAQVQAAFVALAFGALVYAFIEGDFSVRNVAENSHSRLPVIYRITAAWGSHEGSMLLWSLILALWSLAVSWFSRDLPRDILARVLGVMGLVSTGFLSFILLTSNPFERLLPAPPDGRDLNPLLQDPGMVIHPPILYMGYVGFSVAFAFAIAALLSGRLDTAWARWSRPWTTVAWSFLGTGIMLGSWWAYYELGWGGWWFWDPVENASFMPWLVGTALIHSLAVTEKRGAFRSWTVLLAIAAFSLSLLGTFLVRSGVLTSVHAFVTEPARARFILGFLVVTVGGSLVLFAWRAGRVGLGGRFAPLSREGMLLANNVLFSVAAATVLIGTLLPLVVTAFGLGSLSVGTPYFNSMFASLMAPLLFLLAIGPITRWKKTELPELSHRMRWAFACSLVAGLLLPLLLGDWGAIAALGYTLAIWVVLGCGVSLRGVTRHGGWAALARQPRAYYGMQLAHFGVAVFVFGVTTVLGYQAEKELRMTPGQVVELAGYHFRFNGVLDAEGPNYSALRGHVEISSDGSTWRGLNPEKRRYHATGMVMTEAAIDTGLVRDLYVSLGEALEGSAWSVRLQYKPLVVWVWAGVALMAIGGVLATLDRRYRQAQRSVAPAAVTSAA
jgi:cytochrome c-type biogenesis protein CcmF